MAVFSSTHSLQTAAVLLAVLWCTSTWAAPAKNRIITYNQSQNGSVNAQVDLENVLILIVPSKELLETASGIKIFDFGRSENREDLSSPEIDVSEDVKEQKACDPGFKRNDKGFCEFIVSQAEPMKAPSEVAKKPTKKPSVVVSEEPDHPINSEAVTEKISAPTQTVVPEKESVKPEKPEVAAIIKVPEPASLEPADSAVETAEPTVASSDRSGKQRSVVSVKLLGYGLSPALD